LGHKWWAIGLSAVFFGMAHSVIQQSISAAALGLVIGYIAVQSGSLIPGMLFHASYNGMMIGLSLLPELAESWFERLPALKLLVDEPEAHVFTYRMPVAIVAGVGAMGVLWWFHRLPFQATKEERLEDARAHQSQQLAVGQSFQADSPDPSGSAA
jgi:sodium transport system permease protein